MNQGSTRWAIHIHGLGSSAAATLASFITFREAGYHSLTTTYGDPRRTTLGQDEHIDIDRLVHYAVTNGATSIILVGWSMGAAIARPLIDSSIHAPLIHGVLLVSPMLDWRNTVDHAARVTRIPRFIARAGLSWVAHPRLSRTVGLRQPIDVDAMSWFGGVPVSTLILHSPNDRTTPYADSATLAAESSVQVTLRTLAAPMHTTEWNVAPDACSDMLANWLHRFEAVAQTDGFHESSV
ncbi:alpha/beta hydrolase [Leucobacter japonicus]|uniref:alpha/beta hydrolase n=1 Tax=Leucobacter japonicus TaxID=1461259 RepID=UPI0006A79D63|nr:alpha/beta fold hydrolase [Leucobacter japonicus]